MPPYSAIVDLTVHRTYTVILVVDDAEDEADAVEKIRHLALGMRPAEFDALVDAEPTVHSQDNTYTTVEAVREPEEEELTDDERDARTARTAEAEDTAWGEYAADDPEGALRDIQRLAEEDEKD